MAEPKRSIKQKIKEAAIDLTKDLTGITNFENSADAFKRAQATQNAVDGNIGKGLSSLPSYAKDIGVGIGQAALGVGTAAINFLPAGKARTAADKVSGLITGGGKKVVTKTEILSTEVNQKVTNTNKNAADAKAAAANAAKELAAAKKAAADAKIKADNAKTAEDAKKANEAKRKAEQEVKDALAAKKATEAKAAEAKVIADQAAADKVLVDKALANEKAAVEKAAALKAKQDADAKTAADLKAKKEADAKAAADAKAKAAADLKAKQDADAKISKDKKEAREKELKDKQDAITKAREDVAAAKAKREEDALKAKKDRDANQDARLKELEDARLKREEDAKKREDDLKKKREDDAKKREEDAAAAVKLRDDAKAKREEEIRLKKESQKGTGVTDVKGGFVPDGDGGLGGDDNTDVVIDPFGSSKDDKDAAAAAAAAGGDGGGIIDHVDGGDNGGDGGGGGEGGNGTSGGPDVMLPDGDGGVTETEVFPEEDPAAAAAAAAAAAKKAEEDRLAAEKRTSNLQLLKSLLRGMGFSSAFIDKSTTFLMDLMSDDIEPDNAVSIFLDSKDYTFKNGGTKNSPFYDDYGYLNDGLTQPKSAKDIYHFVEGTRNLVKSYNVSSKFAEPDALKKYVANNVTVEKLDERMMSAKLKTITADPQYVNTLRELKYINKSEDLTDFFLDPTIGEAQLEINRKTASFATEAMRRSNLTTGISFNPNSLTATAANLIGQGRSEAEIGNIANQGYETISEVLQPEVGLSNIFEGTGAANAQTIQSELEAEQFLNMGSARRKKLKELGTNVFKESSGRNTGRTTTYSNYSSAGQI